MKFLSGKVTATVFNNLKAEGQRAWYGVARDMVVDTDDLRPENPEDERKGYKFDETADIRSLLDHFMTTASTDKSLTCLKPKMDEAYITEIPENNFEVLMFFRQRMASLTAVQETALAPIEENLEGGDNQIMLAPNTVLTSEAESRFAPSQLSDRKSARSTDKRQQQQQGSKDGEDQKEKQQEFSAKITGRVNTGRSLLQELADKLKEKEQSQSSAKRDQKGRKWHDSADYP